MFLKRITSLNKILLLLNIAFVLFFLTLFARSAYYRLEQKQAVKDRNYSYADNPFYREQTGFFTLFQTKANIVMLGNSLTGRMQWNELLERTDVVNRGIGSDITGGYVQRLNSVINTHPRICFIEGGSNDIDMHISNRDIVANLNAIVNRLLENKIIPVIVLTTYVSSKYPGYAHYNEQIKSLNTAVSQFFNKRHVQLIDLNASLSGNNTLRDEFTIDDGIHLTAKAYLVWKDEIIKILKV